MGVNLKTTNQPTKHHEILVGLRSLLRRYQRPKTQELSTSSTNRGRSHMASQGRLLQTIGPNPRPSRQIQPRQIQQIHCRSNLELKNSLRNLMLIWSKNGLKSRTSPKLTSSRSK